MFKRACFLVFVFLLTFLPLGLQKPPKAKVIRVIDGDTLKVILNGREEYVRLAGIDAPELKRGGEISRDFLSRLCPVGSVISLKILGRDSYGRLLAVVYNENGNNVNQEMLKQNLAVPLCRP
jgi:endonuclease YncB( thermonuclease family)